MIHLDICLVFALLVIGFIYMVFNYPVIMGCVAVIYGVGFVYVSISDKREKAKRIRVSLDVDKKYSEMSESQRARIVNAVMDGAGIDEFSLEDGWLKRGRGDNAKYAKPGGKWGFKENHLDNHPLYSKEKEIIQRDFSKFNLSDAETHELCSLMYFNWVIVGVEGSPKELIVSLTRRGEHVFKRYSRLAVKHAE